MSNAAETFELDYSNLLEALGELDDAWRDWRSPVGAGISSIYSKLLSILFKINEIELSKDLANEQFLSILSKINHLSNILEYLIFHLSFNSIQDQRITP